MKRGSENVQQGEEYQFIKKVNLTVKSKKEKDMSTVVQDIGVFVLYLAV